MSARTVRSRVMSNGWAALVTIWYLALFTCGLWGILILLSRGLSWKFRRRGVFRFSEPARMPQEYRRPSPVRYVEDLAVGDVAAIGRSTIVMERDGRTWVRAKAELSDQAYLPIRVRMEKRGVTLLLPPADEWNEFEAGRRNWMLYRHLPVVAIERVEKRKPQAIAS
jgi:hypothetical protein